VRRSSSGASIPGVRQAKGQAGGLSLTAGALVVHPAAGRTSLPDFAAVTTRQGRADHLCVVGVTLSVTEVRNLLLRELHGQAAIQAVAPVSSAVVALFLPGTRPAVTFRVRSPMGYRRELSAPTLALRVIGAAMAAGCKVD